MNEEFIIQQVEAVNIQVAKSAMMIAVILGFQVALLTLISMELSKINKKQIQ